MTLLAFDLATQTGWAVGAREPVMGSRRLGPVGCAHSVVGGGLLYLMDELISKHKPELILFEEPIKRIVQSDGKGNKGIQLNPATLYRLGGLAFLCEAVASTHGIPVQAVNLHAARTMFLGRGATPRGRLNVKAAVMEGCRLRGWHVENDDESDAACIWATHATGAAGSPLFARGA